MNDVWHEHCSSIAASGGDHESPQLTRPGVHVVTAHNTRIQMVRTMQAASKGREKTQTAPATSVSTWVLLFIPVVLSSSCWHAKQLNFGSVSNALQSILSSNSFYQRGQHGQGSDCKHGGQCSTGQNSIRECPAAQQMIDWIRSHGGVVSNLSWNCRNIATFHTSSYVYGAEMPVEGISLTASFEGQLQCISRQPSPLDYQACLYAGDCFDTSAYRSTYASPIRTVILWQHLSCRSMLMFMKFQGREG